MTAPFELRAQFQVVVNLAVEDDYSVAVFGNDRLAAGIEIDDLQPRRAERNGARFENALLVGAAVNDGGNSALYAAGVR